MALITTTTTSILSKEDVPVRFGTMLLDALTTPVSVILMGGVVLLVLAIIFQWKYFWRYIQSKDKTLNDKDAYAERLMDKIFTAAKVLDELTTLIRTLVNKGR